MHRQLRNIAVKSIGSICETHRSFINETKTTQPISRKCAKQNAIDTQKGWTKTPIHNTHTHRQEHTDRHITWESIKRKIQITFTTLLAFISIWRLSMNQARILAINISIFRCIGAIINIYRWTHLGVRRCLRLYRVTTQKVWNSDTIHFRCRAHLGVSLRNPPCIDWYSNLFRMAWSKPNDPIEMWVAKQLNGLAQSTEAKLWLGIIEYEGLNFDEHIMNSPRSRIFQLAWVHVVWVCVCVSSATSRLRAPRLDYIYIDAAESDFCSECERFWKRVKLSITIWQIIQCLLKRFHAPLFFVSVSLVSSLFLSAFRFCLPFMIWIWFHLERWCTNDTCRNPHMWMNFRFVGILDKEIYYSHAIRIVWFFLRHLSYFEHIRSLSGTGNPKINFPLAANIQINKHKISFITEFSLMFICWALRMLTIAAWKCYLVWERRKDLLAW